jgi:hypothetical protein
MGKMYRMLFLAMSLIVMGASPSLTLAETPSSETVIVVPMNSLPSYGSLVSAWYKQPVYDTAEKRVGTVADMLFSADGSIDAVMLDVGGFMGLVKNTSPCRSAQFHLPKRKTSLG